MMSNSLRRIRPLSLFALFAAAASCADAGPLTVGDAPSRAIAGAPAPLVCAAVPAAAASGLLGVPGGTLRLNGHALSLPSGAVGELTEFSLSVPASDRVEVQVRAGGAQHFSFLAPVTLTLDYSRCTDAELAGKTLRVFYWDRETGEFLQDMGGTDDRANRRIQAQTDHLSDYVVGVN